MASRVSEMSIGALARETACNVETIRYYERIGILPRPRRSASGYRLYSADDARRLVFVRRARELGFTLDETRALLDLAADGGGACRGAYDIAAAHLDRVRAKIAHLRTMEHKLTQAVRQCAAGERQACPVIDALSS